MAGLTSDIRHPTSDIGNIAGHTHRPVFSNLSLTEKWLLHLGIGTPGIERKSPDPAYHNTGSCVHPRCITGIEITAGEDQQADIKLIKWAYSAEPGSESTSCHAWDDFNLVVKRTVLEPEVRCPMSDVRGRISVDGG